MPKSPQGAEPGAAPAVSCFGRLDRPLSLVAQVEQVLREAILDGQFAAGRLPTEVELAAQMGVSRDTVRRAAGVLQREGLLVKIRRRGTFLQPQGMPRHLKQSATTLLGYFQADYRASQGREEAATQTTSGLMLQGAIHEAGAAGFQLIVRHAPQPQLREVLEQLAPNVRLRGIVFASGGEEKLLRRMLGQGTPLVLLDHDLPLLQVSSVRDDSFAGARQAVQHLASLGHRRIAFAHWHQTDLNPWRLRGYRQGLRDAGLPRRRHWEIMTELTDAGARRVVEQWLALSPRPTALYCFNNTLARLMIGDLRRHGLQVPEEVSILGGGGEEIADLTCHQADWYQMGRTAVQQLLRAIAAPDRPTPEHHLAPHTLRVGQTTAQCLQC